jgi:heme/copper-type cytochrome/quinol oxidase subunit 2
MPSTGKLRVIRRTSLIVSAALLAIATISPALAGWGMPTPITDQAQRIEDLWVFTLIIAVAVFFGVEGALLYAIIRFRKRSDELPKQTHGSMALEIVWTSIPVLIVIALFSYSFIVLRDVEKKAPENALTIDVTGFQFSWEFGYSLNDLGRNSDPNASGKFFDSRHGGKGADVCHSRWRTRGIPAQVQRRDPLVLSSELPLQAGRDTRAG